MFNFFKKKQNEVEIPQVQPMAAWEENSYMHVLSDRVDNEDLSGAKERIEAIEGVKLIEFNERDDGSGNLTLEYKGEEYGVGFYFEDFVLESLYSLQNQKIHDEDFLEIKEKDSSFVIHMNFNKNYFDSYHLQLKLIMAFFPDALAVVDESAERLLSGRWVKLAAESSVTPNAESLFTVQAVFDDETKKVWLHTHGMCRTGFSEFELLDISQENANDIYYLLNTVACRVLYQNEAIEDYIFLGEFIDGNEIVVAPLPWNVAIEKYPSTILGGPADRVDSHNTNSQVIFLFLSEEDANNGKYTKPSEIEDKLIENPLYYYTNEQTDHMKFMARDRYELLRNAILENPSYRALIKVGLPTDGEDGKPDYENLEHIWFELIEFTEEGFKAVLTQAPYRVSAMKEGDEGEYTVNDVTDWIIYTDEMSIDPNTAYLL